MSLPPRYAVFRVGSLTDEGKGQTVLVRTGGHVLYKVSWATVLLAEMNELMIGILVAGLDKAT
jgi:hypothetical protein